MKIDILPFSPADQDRLQARLGHTRKNLLYIALGCGGVIAAFWAIAFFRGHTGAWIGAGVISLVLPIFPLVLFFRSKNELRDLRERRKESLQGIVAAKRSRVSQYGTLYFITLDGQEVSVDVSTFTRCNEGDKVRYERSLHAKIPLGGGPLEG